jgi:HAD superfamily hydrolase (TIGR01549 family)
MPPRLICFDAGFTLIRPRQSMEERLAAVLTAHGHAAQDDDLRRAWEAADAWFWDEYHQPGNTTWTSDERIDETWRSYHERMIGALGFPDVRHDLIQAVLESQFASDAWELYPDTTDALRYAHAATVPGPGPLLATRPQVGVVSDWESSLPEVLASLGLDSWVDFVVASGAVGLAKPGPELFLLACDRAGVDPDAAVMIGDNLQADVLGARSAGLQAVLLDRNGVAGDVDSEIAVAQDLVSAVEVALTLGGGSKAENVP